MDIEQLAADAAAKQPEKYEARDGKLFLKFDRVCVFWYEPLKSMVAQYQLNGEVAHNVKIEGAPRLMGEITIGPCIGLLPLHMEVAAEVPPLLDDGAPCSTEPRH